MSVTACLVLLPPWLGKLFLKVKVIEVTVKALVGVAEILLTPLIICFLSPEDFSFHSIQIRFLE